MALLPTIGIVLLFLLATVTEGEKNRVIILAGIQVLLLAIFYGVVDPVMGGGITQDMMNDGTRIVIYPFSNTYWALMPVLYGLTAVGVALGSLLGDYSLWSMEDYLGAVLLIVTPFLLVFCGVMDWLSASVIDWHATGVFAQGFPWTYEWWWMDSWSLPYYVSYFSGYQHVQWWSIPIGITIGLVVLVALWLVYHFKA